MSGAANLKSRLDNCSDAKRHAQCRRLSTRAIALMAALGVVVAHEGIVVALDCGDRQVEHLAALKPEVRVQQRALHPRDVDGCAAGILILLQGRAETLLPAARSSRWMPAVWPNSEPKESGIR